MRMLISFLIVSVWASCSYGGVDDTPGLSPDEELDEDVAHVVKNTKAVKTINTFDELACVAYYIGPDPAQEPTRASIDYTIDDDCTEGFGSFGLVYSFSGLPMTSRPEYVYFEELQGDYRYDLSFHPLGLSLWVKGNSANKGTFRFILMEDAEQFVAEHPHDATRERWRYFTFEDKEILSKDGWNRLVMPYSTFVLTKGNAAKQDDSLRLNRCVGYRIEVVNEHNEAGQFRFSIDALEQLTSYEPSYGKPRFSSIFIQLFKGTYDQTDWDKEFQDSKEVGIDTWIVNPVGMRAYTDELWTFYEPTSLPWVVGHVDILNKMFEAAERNGMKLILGLYPGAYSTMDTTAPAVYDQLYERDTQVFDELFPLFGKHPCLAGWYIAEEFHDGSYPVGWQQEPALSQLASYLQRVASYIKSKSSKDVCIAPALWRGMPADLCGEWFGRIFAQTPDIDVLYLQDVGGRCLVDFDVDLPNWYAEIKKACDAHGVTFGVDVESFKNCWCPDIPMQAKEWEELEEQLLVAGMFTEHITNFSWATFKKGTDNYEGYKQYLMK